VNNRMGSAFQQAAIKIEKEKEFSRLRDAIERVFSPPQVNGFLKELKKKGIRVRDFEAALNNGCIDGFDSALADSGLTARSLYESLGFSDQGQIREFYLERLEKVDVELRARYAKVYQVI
jgi:hypothetical protein